MLVKLKKYIATALIVLLAFVAAAGGLLAPEPAHAQLATFTFGDIPAQLKDIGAQIYKALISALKVATVRTVAYAVRKVSYDSAVWLASGAKGQNPFAQTKDFGSYIKSLGDDVAGTFIEQMGTDKLNLCHVPDIKVDLAMKIGLRTDFGGAGGIGGGAAGPGKPKCSLSQMAGNWSQEFDSKYGASSIAGRMTSINNLFQADSNSDLGIQIQTTEKLANTVQQQVVAGTLERQEGRGFKGKETPISGQIQTPAELIAEQFKANTPDKAAKEDSDTVKQALTSDEPSVLAVGLSIFLNTLVSTAITNFRDKGTLPTAVETPGGTKADSISDIPTGGTQVAAEFYRELQTVKINEVANYDVLSQLTSCPDVPGTYNCRANDDLVTALKRADAGEPVTIDQALKQGWLHGAWPLIPPSSAKNNDRDCYQSNYCYSNIQVLRQLRILPLGFEIAAKNSNPDRPWTLAQVEEGFDNCTFIDPNDHSKGIVDDPVGHPFCRLIDPDWVLKSPLTKCKIKAPGPLLASAGVPNRLEDCMDVQTCVHYTADGVCDNYGYCTREADKWKFKAEECAPYAATCRTFTNAVSGASASYLQRTLDTGFCSEQNIGCTAYSLTQQNGRWQAPKIQGADQGFTNAGIYFNKNISNSCSANSEGCSAFLVGGGRTNDLLYLKKAPDYLKCYDANPATAAVEWPQSVADLTRIKLNAAAACGNYAAACIPEEVSCNLYTPGAGGEAVPGRYTPHEIAGGQIKWNDECDQSCVGYAAYREMPGRYSVGQPVAYVIPRSEAVCSAAAAGCTGFTNLQTTSGGLEQVEYFSYLRPCANPEKEKGKLYITYEGSQAGGFQLKTYILVENNDTANGPVGAPKYFYRDDAELQNNLAECNEQRYKEGKAAADCRQFNDEQGHIYYRLLSFTIPVTAACTPYRLSNPELDSNGKCLQNGEYRDGSCFYSGLPSGTQNTAGASQTCSAAVDTCRAYKGTEAGKAGQVFSDTFESPSTTVALSGWSGSVSLSTESTRAKEHSLQIIGSGAKKVDLDAAASFDAIFWAKGSGGGTLTVQLKRSDGAEQDFGTVGIGDAWQQYHLGPIELDGASTVGGSYIFTVAGGGQVWVDNVTLNHSVDVKYLVKKKLTVPAACDSNPNDNLPGEALGCTAYTAANNNPVNLVNFSQLCRAEAIGCTAALNTQNTVTAVNGRYQSGDEGARAYNVFLTGKGGVTAKAVIGADSYSCAVPVGAAGCYLDKPILNHSAAEIQAAAGVSFVKSTVFIPGDTPADKPIYLVASKPATCSQLDLGCTLAGVAKATPTGVTYVTTTIKNDPNDPDGYTKTLCQAEAVGCQKYTDTANSSFYFKDPDIVGQKICAYKTDVLIGGIKKNGWFWKGVGVCTAANQTNNGVICGDNSDCAGGYTCQGKDVQPCYPDYIQNGNSYGLWSYGNADKYQNFVGACQSGQDKCTEFVDHVKTDRSNPAKSIDRAYYLINDPSKLNPGDCAGGASQKAGCTLLDQTDNPNKYWSRDLSYQASDAKGGAKVAPVNSADQARPNDTNVLFKVVRDRDCGEWLGCSYTRTVFDSAIGNFKDTCENIQRCDKPGSCGVLKSAYTGNILTEERYRARAVGWNGDHFSGYSILGLFPVEELEDVNFEETGKGAPDFRLVKKVACGAVNCASGSTCTTNDTACGNGGWCVNHTCVRSIVGESVSSANLDLQPKQACRGYPEKDSPFPSLDFGRNAPDYALANTCAEKRAADGSAYLCDCDYTKIGFGQVMKYWNYTNPGANGIDHAAGGTVTEVAKINGVCIGGPNGLRGEEKACDKDSDCGKGICQPKDKESRVLGLKGYCLEYDTTRNLYGDASKHPCLTWYPGKLNGVPDLFNQYVDAGFNISSFGYDQGPFYCKEAELWRFKEVRKVTGYVDCDGALQPGGAGTNYVKAINGTPTDNWPTAQNVLDNITGKNLIPNSGGVNCNNSNVCGQHAKSEYFYNAGTDYANDEYKQRLECSPGYKLGKIRKITPVNSIDCGWGDGLEDKVTLEYECVRDSAQSPGAIVSPGEALWEVVVSQPSALDYNSKDPDQEIRCKIMVQIADKPEETVAMTQGVWGWLKGPPAKPKNACVIDSLSLNTLPAAPYAAKITGNFDLLCAVGAAPEAANAATQRPLMYFGNVLATISAIRDNYFAKAVKAYSSSGSHGQETFIRKSQPTPPNPDEVWNITGTGSDSVTPLPPAVLSVGDCRLVGDQEVCPEGAPGLTIFANQRYYTTEDVRLNSGTQTVNMRFFAFAQNEQMPIRQLSVQWGDNTNDDFTSGNPSYYRNLRGGRDGVCLPPSAGTGAKSCVVKNLFKNPYIGTSNIFTDYRTDKTCTTDTDCRAVELCRKETGTSQFFGLLKDKTCTTGYFQFKNHVYTCNATLNKDNFFAACPVSGDYPNGCCVFTPRVQVKDNWGWCNGSCADTASIKHPNGGCYDASWMEDSLGRPTGVDECYTMGFNKDLPHWTNFGGKVIVAP